MTTKNNSLKIHRKAWARIAAFLLVATLIVGQIGPFRGIDVNVHALSFIRQWMYVSLSSGTVNVRTGPSTSYTASDYLSDGHRVYVWTSEVTNGTTWYLVTYMSGNYPRTGYVSSAYVQPKSWSADSTFESYLSQQGFPESYKPALRRLHALYPSWVFRADKTNLDWNTVLDNESAAFRSVIPMSFNKSLRSTDPVTYVESSDIWKNSNGSTISSAGWVMSNRQTLSFYLDPRNMLDGYRAFMFESLSYDSQVHTASGVNAILGSTFMGNQAAFDYNGGQVSYAQAFMDAASASNVSPYHLAARARQEVGNYSGSVTGTYSASYPRVYNYYNIGANDTGDPVLNGLQWALLGSDRNAAYTSTDETYLIPWQDSLDSNGNVTTALGRYRSIVGGAKYIGNAYINVGQDTLYLQKFDVDNDSKYGLYSHQYMTNIGAPYSEATSMASSYASMGASGSNFVFYIPVYNNMPDEPVPLPVGNGNVNNYLSALKVNGTAVSPSFNRSTSSGYTVSVPYETTVADIQPTTESQYAAVSITGPSSLAVGNNPFTITVQASYGNDARTYSVNVVRQLPTDTTLPIITVAPYLTTPTNQDVTVTATTNEGTLNATTYTFTENGSFTFIATDASGNVAQQVVTITNIDKTAPATPTAAASPDTATNGTVTVTPTFSADAVVKQYRLGVQGNWTDYTAPIVLNDNETVYFKAQDAAGNWSTEGALIVSIIDRTAPDAPTAAAAPTAATKDPVTVTPTYPADAAKREYRIGSSEAWIAYTTPFTVAENTTVYLRSLDAAGNASTVTELVISNIDTTAPVMPTAEASTTAVTTQPVTVTATYPTDAVVKQYRIGLNGTWTAYTAPITLEKNQMLYFRGQDAVGNWSLTGSLEVTNIDTAPVAPTVVADITAVTDGSVWLTATYSPDTVSTERYYRFDAAGTWLHYTGPVEVKTDETTVYFMGKNGKGTSSLETSFTVSNIDLSFTPAPTATASTLLPTNQNVTVSAVFSPGSIRKEYKLGSSTAWTPYAEPIVVTSNDTVSFRSANSGGIVNAGQTTEAVTWSETTTITIANIDKTAPVITVGTYATDPINKDLTVTATTDEGTLNATSYTFSANGSYTFVATDKAGNTASKTVTISHIDKTAPVTPTGSASTLLATNQPVSVTATFAADTTVRQYRLSTTADWTDYTEPVVFTANGTIYLKAQDAAGNWSAEGSLVIKNIDTTPPTTPTAAASVTTATVGPVIVTASYSADSAIRQFKVGSTGTWTAYTGRLSVSANTTLSFRSQDAVGNLSSEYALEITNIDPTLGSGSTSTGNSTVSNSTTSSTVTLQLAAVVPEIQIVTILPDETPASSSTGSTGSTGGSGSSGDSGGSGGSGGGGGEPVAVQSSTFKISGNTITGLNPTTNSNTVASLTSHLSVPTGASVAVLTPSGATLGSSAKIGTGYQIKVVAVGAEPVSYTAIVYGDTNGDGSINITDVATLFKYIRNKQTLGTAYQLAGDTDRNNKVNITDVATAFKHVRNKLTIVQ